MKHAVCLLPGLAIVLAASSAGAQPALNRDTCAVTFVRVPGEVRTVVEQWVKAEPKCNTQLEIRIVPTTGGLYLLARDPSGRIRERVVPDAQSAGVLVASWVAADSLSPYEVRKPPAAEPVPPEAMLGPSGMLAPGEGRAPGAVTPVAATVAAAPTKPEQPRWLSLGPIVSMTGTGGGGMRGEWDVKTYRSGVFGISGSAGQEGMTYQSADYYSDTIDLFDTKVMGFAGLVGQGGRWHMRGTISLGVVYTHAQLNRSYSLQKASGLFPTGEMQLLVGREIGDHWAIDAGPILEVFAQKMQLESSSSSSYYYANIERNAAMLMYIALRYKL